MSLDFPINALVDALRAKILETWPEVTRVPEGLSPEEFAPANLPIACIVKHPTAITPGQPAARDLSATTPFDLVYVAAPAAGISPGDLAREKCVALLKAIRQDPRLTRDGAPTCLSAAPTRLDDTPENPAMQLILRHRWSLFASALRVECKWTESELE